MGVHTTDRVAAGGSRRQMVIVAVALLMVAAVALSLWVLRAAGTGGDVPPAEDALAVPGGYVVVDRVAPERMYHPKSMPTKMIPDPVPDGFRRVSVYVTLHAQEDAALTFEASDLTVDGPGMAPAKPRRDTVGEGSIPAGARLAGSLLFQVPADAERLSLGFEGAPDSIPLRLPAGGHGHDAGTGEGAPQPQGGVVPPDGHGHAEQVG